MHFIQSLCLVLGVWFCDSDIGMIKYFFIWISCVYLPLCLVLLVSLFCMFFCVCFRVFRLPDRHVGMCQALLIRRPTLVGKAFSFTHELPSLFFSFFIFMNKPRSAAAQWMAIKCTPDRGSVVVKLQQLIQT